MAIAPVSIAKKLEDLEENKKERIAKIEEQLKQQKKALLAKRKDELYKIFLDSAALTIDDRLLVGFLKFATNKENKDHPTLKEFKEAAIKSKSPSKQSK